MPTKIRKTKYDYSAFYRGEPIKIDIAEEKAKNVENCTRRFLRLRGYPDPHIEKVYDTKPPFRAWLIADWQRPAKTPYEKKKEHPWYAAIEKGQATIKPENWETLEQAKNRFFYFMRTLGIPKRLFFVSDTKDLRGEFCTVYYKPHESHRIED